ncbi:PA domain-containing protein [Edaphobacter bradus]|uniref:PA domain-containing protein n=1 Tax=Edaphobacter bradus TaxID=2259016 RepID=UPI0021E0DCFF|nr:PA domain-containing protein [Edaphobacter bradus]
MIRKNILTILLSAVACTTAFAQNPPFANGTFCTQGKGYYSNNVVPAAEDLQTVQNNYPEFSSTRVAGSSAPGNLYQWVPTGTLVDIGKGVLLDSAYVDLRQALGANGKPGAFSMNATNATDMGTAGTLATQRVALGLNADFSYANAMVLPVGFNVLNLTNTGGLTLDGQLLTTTQADALNGRAVLEVLDAADSTLGTGQPAFPLSFGQLTDLLGLLNQSFAGCQPSAFAQSFLYQPYITSPSGAFSGRRPIGNAGFALRPSAGTFHGEIVNVGRGCNVDTYLANPNGKIALIQRGLCTFVEKITKAKANGATAAIVYNSSGHVLSRGEGVFEMGGGSQPTWLHIADPATDIPAVFVQRSTGLALINNSGGGTTPVTVFVKE